MPIPDIIKLFPDIEPGSFSFLTVLDRFHEGVIITDARGTVLKIIYPFLVIVDIKNRAPGIGNDHPFMEPVQHRQK